MDVASLKWQTEQPTSAPEERSAVPTNFDRPRLRSVAHLPDEELAAMYEEVCVQVHGEKRIGVMGSATALASVLGYSRETVSKKLKRLKCPAVEKRPTFKEISGRSYSETRILASRASASK